MIELRLVCSGCGRTIEAKDNINENGYAVIFSDPRYICLTCGKDMEHKVVKIEIDSKIHFCFNNKFLPT